MAPQNNRLVAFKIAATEPHKAKNLSSWINVWPNNLKLSVSKLIEIDEREAIKAK